MGRLDLGAPNGAVTNRPIRAGRLGDDTILLLHASWTIHSLAFYITQNHIGPSCWRLRMQIFLLYFLWRLWNTFHWEIYESYVMSILSPLSWLLHSSFWLGLYRRQVSAPFVCGVNIRLANNKCCSILFETAVNFAILISWRVFLNVRCLVCCTTRGRWNTGCMNQ